MKNKLLALAITFLIISGIYFNQNVNASNHQELNSIAGQAGQQTSCSYYHVEWEIDTDIVTTPREYIGTIVVEGHNGCPDYGHLATVSEQIHYEMSHIISFGRTPGTNPKDCRIESFGLEITNGKMY